MFFLFCIQECRNIVPWTEGGMLTDARGILFDILCSSIQVKSQCQTYLNLRLKVGGHACSGKRGVNDTWIPGSHPLTSCRGPAWTPSQEELPNCHYQQWPKAGLPPGKAEEEQGATNPILTKLSLHRRVKKKEQVLRPYLLFFQPLYYATFHCGRPSTTLSIDDWVRISTSNSVYWLARAVTTKYYKLSALT